MDQPQDYMYEAVAMLKKNIGADIQFQTAYNGHDAIMSINGLTFTVEAKSAIRNSNKSLVIAQFSDKVKRTSEPLILVVQYISRDAAEGLREPGINYLDVARNAYINHGSIHIQISGQKASVSVKTNRSRAFQEAGVRLLFVLLTDPAGLQMPYRELANAANVSIGSVSNIFGELEERNYMIRSKNQRILTRKRELLERWIISYNEVLRPRILRRKMRFISKDGSKNWRNLNFDLLQEKVLWGGETGAAFMGGKIKPAIYTLYTNADIPLLSNTLKMVPDDNGEIEILQKFWSDQVSSSEMVPPLLLYADLVISGLERNLEMAKTIFQNELQHIK